MTGLIRVLARLHMEPDAHHLQHAESLTAQVSHAIDDVMIDGVGKELRGARTC